MRIETERLVLRPWAEADRDALFALNGDPRVGEWLGGALDRAANDAALARVAAHHAEHGFGICVAERRADARIVGMIGLSTVRAGDLPVGPTVEIAWRLIPDAWSGGYASEGARAVLDWGFETLKLDEIVAFTARTNLRSQAVMQRIGMRPSPERDFDHPRLAADHPLRPHVVYVAARS